MNDFREASFMSYQNSESEIQKLALNSSLVLLSESDEDSNEEFRHVYKNIDIQDDVPEFRGCRVCKKIKIYDLSSVKIKIHDPYFCLRGASCIEEKDFALQKESLKIGERLTDRYRRIQACCRDLCLESRNSYT